MVRVQSWERVDVGLRGAENAWWGEIGEWLRAFSRCAAIDVLQEETRSNCRLITYLISRYAPSGFGPMQYGSLLLRCARSMLRGR